MQGYTIKIQQFEGPFDLLLFFIERDELDVNNIPISKITEDFLNYIKELEKLNIDIASEFILVAATLMRIKAKLLIPRKEVDEEGNEIDPREELTQKLLEYKKYKEIIDELRDMEQTQSTKHDRGNVSKELKQIANKALVDSELESFDLFKLLKTYQKVLDRFENRKREVVHEIVSYNYTIENQQAHIIKKMSVGTRSTFTAIFEGLENRVHAIVTFLALLELLNLQRVVITQGEGFNNFWIDCYVSSVDGDEEE
ncbi:MAG: segregation/condensation protein A [Saprospiraceae bacterium]|nr:segregation/condensation protein A [Saprospiraceae bacterium]